jgi:transposase
MVFSAFTIDRAIDLVVLEGDLAAKQGGVTGRVILECLKEHLPEIIGEGMTFLHDNGPTFKSHLVQRWLRKYAQREGVILINWPPYSPDLNPIENLWSILKERICTRYPELSDMPKTQAAKDRLIEAAQELWHELEDEVFENLLNSMPKRMQAVIDADGWYTKY